MFETRTSWTGKVPCYMRAVSIRNAYSTISSWWDGKHLMWKWEKELMPLILPPIPRQSCTWPEGMPETWSMMSLTTVSQELLWFFRHTHTNYVYVFVYITIVGASLEARRGSWMPGSCSYRLLWASWCRCREPTLSPLEEQRVLSTAELSLQVPEVGILKHILSWKFKRFTDMH